ncbi:MAG: 5-(carboxyamino)imidazole ribonucleotide mutase [Symbiobacteriaceae bacterium]|nr:5-(carboxyamino)imidazole ribonucleotide mutase [Symbiobacteriaceae bacterium]
MGSDSDLRIMSEAAKILESFAVGFEMSIASAHRSTDYVLEQTRSAVERGVRVIIAGAGLAAHLPGVIAAATPLPVIGIPLQSGALAGQDALYSIVQMPPGIPVATVGIGAAQNAALLALRILGCYDVVIRDDLVKYSQKMRDAVLDKNAKLASIGFRQYLEGM